MNKRKVSAVLLLSSVLWGGVSRAQQGASADATAFVKKYVDLRLRWAEWKEYSPLISWGDEPGWDCYRIASGYHLGRTKQDKRRILVPVTFDRIGLYCHDFDLKLMPATETIEYSVVRKNGTWEISGPQPEDYPYVSETRLRESLTQIADDRNETVDRRQEARRTLRALSQKKR